MLTVGSRQKNNVLSWKARYPLRNYPDLCHTASAEFAVDGWRPEFAALYNREVTLTSFEETVNSSQR